MRLSFIPGPGLGRGEGMGLDLYIQILCYSPYKVRNIPITCIVYVYLRCWVLGKSRLFMVRLGKEHQVMCKFLCLHLTERKDRRSVQPGFKAEWKEVASVRKALCFFRFTLLGDQPYPVWLCPLHLPSSLDYRVWIIQHSLQICSTARQESHI